MAGVDLVVDPGLFAFLCAVVLLGALLQGVVGLGIGLLGSPVLTLVRPDLMPGSMLVLALLLPFLTLVREHDGVDWRGLGWALPPRVVGTAAGVAVVSALDDRLIGLVVGAFVLGAVLVTWRAVHIPITRGALVSAGLVSGLTGTTSSIGGPPLALLYQRRPPEESRPTIAIYFVVGSALSIAGLLLAGEMTWEEVRLSLSLLPAMAVGVVLAVLLRGRVPQARVRGVMLVVCAASALVLILRSLLG
ncbi:permease [Marmoricola endophyticus]|uniref:Probable membrane transporter protein n=1 Tax=Marmoricola endophyticus TaxID=2040280 RepID=A0A917B9W5_9ACTN|nr:sulfite exporter TauE/SafE family protein [Marmoricola endophyticus]GGF32890.1 permease [Marmoricola endophyticus]